MDHAAAVYVPPVTPEEKQREAELEPLVREIISRVADKWTMLILEVLNEHGRLRFTRLGQLVGEISQKMLTKTVRQMEFDGLICRTVYPVVPPRVEYELTELGRSLGAAFCGVWMWADRYHEEILKAREAFTARTIPKREVDAISSQLAPGPRH